MKEIVQILLACVISLLLGAGITFVSRSGYVRGCSDTMRGLYEKLGLEKIDEDSLKDFCKEKWVESTK